MEDGIKLDDKIYLNSEIAFWYGELIDVENALKYLYKAEELLAFRLVTIHNLFFLLQFMRDMRASIINGSFTAFRENFWAEYAK